MFKLNLRLGTISVAYKSVCEALATTHPVRSKQLYMIKTNSILHAFIGLYFIFLTFNAHGVYTNKEIQNILQSNSSPNSIQEPSQQQKIHQPRFKVHKKTTTPILFSDDTLKIFFKQSPIVQLDILFYWFNACLENNDIDTLNNILETIQNKLFNSNEAIETFLQQFLNTWTEFIARIKQNDEGLNYSELEEEQNKCNPSIQLLHWINSLLTLQTKLNQDVESNELEESFSNNNLTNTYLTSIITGIFNAWIKTPAKYDNERFQALKTTLLNTILSLPFSEELANLHELFIKAFTNVTDEKFFSKISDLLQHLLSDHSPLKKLAKNEMINPLFDTLFKYLETFSSESLIAIIYNHKNNRSSVYLKSHNQTQQLPETIIYEFLNLLLRLPIDIQNTLSENFKLVNIFTTVATAELNDLKNIEINKYHSLMNAGHIYIYLHQLTQLLTPLPHHKFDDTDITQIHELIKHINPFISEFSKFNDLTIQAYISKLRQLTVALQDINGQAAFEWFRNNNNQGTIVEHATPELPGSNTRKTDEEEGLAIPMPTNRTGWAICNCNLI